MSFNSSPWDSMSPPTRKKRSSRAATPAAPMIAPEPVSEPVKPNRVFQTFKRPAVDDDLYAYSDDLYGQRPSVAGTLPKPEPGKGPLSGVLSNIRDKVAKLRSLPQQRRGVNPEAENPPPLDYNYPCSICGNPASDAELTDYDGQCERCALQNTAGSNRSGSLIPNRRENKARRPPGQIAAMRKLAKEDDPWSDLGYQSR